MIRRAVFTLLCGCAAISGSSVTAEEVRTDRLSLTTGDSAVSIAADVSIDGRSYSDVTEEFLRKLFARLDRNGDGSLTRTEAAQAPSPDSLRAQWVGDFYDAKKLVPVSWEELAAAGASKPIANAMVGVEAFLECYRRSGAGRPTLIVDDGYSAECDDGLNLAVLRFLAGTDERLAPDDLSTKVLPLLSHVDDDGDGRIALQELVRLTEAKPVATSAGATRKSEPFAAWEKSASSQAISFAPTICLSDKLEARPSPSGPESFNAAGKPITVRCGSIQGMGRATVDNALTELLQKFEADDADGDGRLDAEERRRSPDAEQWEAPTILADADADQVLTTDELKSYFKLLGDGAARHVVVRVTRGGKPIFTMLDVDDDGRLTPRELVHGWTRIAASDRNGDGEIAWEEIPSLAIVEFSLGLPARAFAKSDKLASKQEPAAASLRWFTAMDRNEDGDVSQREFLGDLATFRKLDVDSDGLLSAHEAAKPAAAK